jgi:endonuclease/exonuclease/phosphatase family metal-dependent hydrolase
LTYNVLADPVAVDRRIPKLLEIIGGANADIIGLQEVAPWFLQRLRRQTWIKHYQLSAPRTRSKEEQEAPGGQLVLSRFPITASTYAILPGRQRRTVVVAEVALPGGRTVAVATVHMESFLEDGPIRAKQLDQMFKLLERHPDAILLGDFNFGDGEQPETGQLKRSYTDLWRALRPKRPGFTWNIEKSAMARKGSFVDEPSRRLDRILVRMNGYRPKQIKIIGDIAVPRGNAGIFPSDHFGLVAEITRN